MRDHEDQFKDLGADVAAVGLGDRRYAAAFREDTGIEFPLFVDEDRLAYQALGLASANLAHLLRRDNARARKRAKEAGFRQHKLGEHVFQLGGSLVLGPGNVDRYVHISETFGDNAPVEEMLSVLRSPVAD